MQEIKPVIQLAKERALFRFSALAQLMLQDAIASIGQFSSMAGTSAEQKSISACRQWLAAEGPQFLNRLYLSYAGYVERGMQTMYHDLRQDLRDVPATTWALIDDDTIVRQIEVERRVLRLRDADQLSLGRLNLMIAQLHDEHDVRERENPFRPYLMARALHDVLVEMTRSSDVCAMLFDHMSGALATHLPDYFAAIREVFESNGVHARLLARPSLMSKQDREVLRQAQQFSNVGLTPHPHPYLVQPGSTPGLEKAFSLMQQASADGQTAKRIPQQDTDAVLQDFVWRIFEQSAPNRLPPNIRQNEYRTSAPRKNSDESARKPHPLSSHFYRLQQAAINNDQAQGDVIPLIDFRNELETERMDEFERVSLEVVTTLFNFIVEETAIAHPYRSQIVRLQVPFLKATMLAPEILEQGDHPVKKLLNRLAAVSIGLDAETALGKQVLSEMTAAVEKILNDFNVDTAIFEIVLTAFDFTLAQLYGATDPDIVRAIKALEDAEKNPQQHDILLTKTVTTLRERLTAIQANSRVSNFLARIWAPVLVHVTEREPADAQSYRDVVADLIWSVQENLDASERSTLMRLLPSLVKRIRAGMQLIAVSDAASQAALDELVGMHAQVLRSIQTETTAPAMPLATLHQHFSPLHKVMEESEEQFAIHVPTVPHIRLQAALKKFDVSAHLQLDSDIGILQNSDAQWLGGMQVGTVIEWWSNGSYSPARLMWVNAQQSFYLFQLEKPEANGARLLICSSIALIKSLREGSISMTEYAPVFDRAIEVLLQSMEPDHPPEDGQNAAAE